MTNKTITLQAASREITGKKVKRNRQKGLLPAVVYGKKQAATSIFIDGKEFSRIYNEAGTSALVDLVIDSNKAIKVILQEPQLHHLTLQPISAELYAVIMDEKIETTIPINFSGESYAVTELEGNLVTSKDELEVRCLPGDLIPAVEVDLSVLKTFEDSIRVKDIVVPETIEILHEPEEVVVSVSEPISQEELDAELAEDTTSEAEAVAELGKDEEAPVAESEEPKAGEEKSE